jgi:hypothetical protein
MQSNFVIPIHGEEVFHPENRKSFFQQRHADLDSDLMVDSEFNDISDTHTLNALESPRTKIHENLDHQSMIMPITDLSYNYKR